jgi:hypothetical protein
MHSTESKKRYQASKVREILEKGGDLTQRQIDMVIVAIMSMPAPAADSVIKDIKDDPANIMKIIKVPAKRY